MLDRVVSICVRQCDGCFTVFLCCIFSDANNSILEFGTSLRVNRFLLVNPLFNYCLVHMHHLVTLLLRELLHSSDLVCSCELRFVIIVCCSAILRMILSTSEDTGIVSGTFVCKISLPVVIGTVARGSTTFVILELRVEIEFRDEFGVEVVEMCIK